MNWFQALILGIIQGLTEYLPVSSSGHLLIGQHFFGLTDGEANLSFTVAVHVATVLSTIVILWREIVWLVRDCLKLRWNEGMRYLVNILISMIPVGIVGFCFKDKLEAVFGGSLVVVGVCLLFTSALLAFSYFAKPRQRENISPLHSFIIGIAQAVAVLPGLSRSGSTIATGLLLGNKKEAMAQFSFLMVIPPILGEALLDVVKLLKPTEELAPMTDSPTMASMADSVAMAAETASSAIPTSSLIVGFIAAFVVGCLACKWMINIVKKGKLIWFALYCAVVGLAVILFH